MVSGRRSRADQASPWRCRHRGSAVVTGHHPQRTADEAFGEGPQTVPGYLDRPRLRPRAAELGLDPTPFLAMVADVLRLYAETLERPDAEVR